MGVTVKRSGGQVIRLTGGQVARIEEMQARVVERRTQVHTVSAPKAVIVGGTSIKGAPGADGMPGLDGSIAPIAFSWGDAPGAVYTPPEAVVVTNVRVVITTPFDGLGAGLEVGTAGLPDVAMTSADNDPSSAGEYELTADMPLAQGEALWLSIAPGFGASAGAGLLYLTAIPAT